MFTAKWTVNTYTVTFHANGQGTAPAEQTVAYGSTAAEPTAPTATDYTFGGWYTDADCTAAYDFTAAVTGNVELYAKWTLTQYPVTIATVKNGEITVDKITAVVGETVTITAKGAENYILGDLTAADKNGNPVSVVNRQFVMPSGGVTVYATFIYYAPGVTPAPVVPTPDPEPEENPVAHLTDVAESAWYYSSVRYVVEKGLMTGTSATTFAPGATTTRAMIWTVLGRVSGADVNGGTPWYAKAQAWSVTAGVSDGTDPSGAITREQLVTMLYRFAGKPAVTEGEKALLDGYKDSEKVSSWAVDAMAWAVSKGIINGTDGALVPQGSAIRSQVAAILQRFCEL